MSSHFQMGEARGGDAFSLPAMHRRSGRVHESGDGGCATQRLHGLVCKSLHGQKLATIAIAMQAETCDNGNCYDREFDFDDGMDGDSLRRIIRERGFKQIDVARVLDLSADKFSKVLAGKRQLTAAETDTIRRFLGIADPNARPAPRRLPIVGLIAAGSWREGFEVVIGWMPSPDPSLSGDAFVVRVQGSSMDLVAKDGEDIIVEPRDRRLVAGKFYVIRNSSGETTFKRYLEGPARLEPCSSDEEHQAIFLGDEPVEVIGRVTKKVTDL
ncbi:MAG: hypothetical protein EON59_00725 [Alphaproteobacteria bacterium]|nr:MAG: hypothetical protein EON59_00725 [Alphaproteobacteria bacterium]